MRHRYENWVDGLNGDWLVSRQRFFGVPVPLWYRLDGNGVADYDVPLIPGDSDLPIDPQSHLPTGFEEAQRDQPGGFTGDPDVLDTWATSSLTPLPVSYTHLRAHETVLDLVCRLLLEKKKQRQYQLAILCD